MARGSDRSNYPPFHVNSRDTDIDPDAGRSWANRDGGLKERRFHAPLSRHGFRIANDAPITSLVLQILHLCYNGGGANKLGFGPGPLGGH